MIEFENKQASAIPPETTESTLPSKEEVQRFFEAFFKKDVDDYLIYKKNQFKNPTTEVIDDFISKLESFVKTETPENKQNFVNLVFKNMRTNIKLLEESSALPNDKKMRAFVFSFLVSKFLS
jgi:hypothetical protein